MASKSASGVLCHRLKPCALLSSRLYYTRPPVFSSAIPVRRTLATATTPAFDEETDVLIVGSGGGGLTAALRAHHYDLRSIVVEKDAKIGGTSAYSGGAVWIPNNHLAKEAGVEDSLEKGLKYMESIIDKDVGPASSRERKLAFLEHGPRMISFLQDCGFQWHFDGMASPDYYPNAPGGMSSGSRTIEGKPFNTKELCSWRDRVRKRPGARNIPLYTSEASSIMRIGSSWKDFAVLLKVLLRANLLALRGQAPVTLGQSLIAQLLFLNKQRDAQIMCNAPLVELIRGEGSNGSPKIIGATIQHEGHKKNIRAHRGVLLTAGGFSHNKELREKWGPSPASIEWTSAPPGDTGDAITAGIAVGADTALLDDAWWGPTMVDPVSGRYFFALTERARPFSMIVDSSGSRFMNEAEPYTDAGHHQYERNQTSKAIPAWLIVDQNFRKRYSLGSLLPLQPDPKTGLQSGFIHKANTIDELAAKIGVDATGLHATLARFNPMARKGVDEDFHRGANAFDNYWGDPNIGPNPNLGPIEKPPFYAVAVVPGDLGTKGGLLTDEWGRVLQKAGQEGAANAGRPIEQLYAAGNTSASVMGRTYTGAGGTLGPALTFAFIAVEHMAKQLKV